MVTPSSPVHFVELPNYLKSTEGAIMEIALLTTALTLINCKRKMN